MRSWHRNAQPCNLYSPVGSSAELYRPDCRNGLSTSSPLEESSSSGSVSAVSRPFLSSETVLPAMVFFLFGGSRPVQLLQSSPVSARLGPASTDTDDGAADGVVLPLGSLALEIASSLTGTGRERRSCLLGAALRYFNLHARMRANIYIVSSSSATI